MISQKKIEANRINAEMSTGPSTPEGKTTVSLNTVKHGLLSKETLLPNEDGSCLEELRSQLELALDPANEMEAILVERIVSLTWRLKRAGRIEAAFFVIEHDRNKSAAASSEVKKYIETQYDTIMAKQKISDKIKDAKNYEIAKAKQEAINAKIDKDVHELGCGFVKNIPILERLQRYEVSMERSLYKALHELQRIQAFRLGLNSSVPVAIDFHES